LNASLNKGVAIGMIEAARTRAVAAVNTTLIDLYWSVGEFISVRIAEDGWGKGTVESLAEAIQRRYPGVTGYSARNLWRMCQFFDIYHDQPILTPLLRDLSWSHNLLIMSRCKRNEEREFYLRLCQRERWGKRELQRQLSGGLFERTALAPVKLSPVVAELYPGATAVFKDSYLLEVVEYALSRSMSPALVAEYQTKLPDKRLLQAKLHEFYQLAESQTQEPNTEH
jgi:predicted nuclease of restriction endonuclease-like (RecB) superfamily